MKKKLNNSQKVIYWLAWAAMSLGLLYLIKLFLTVLIR